MTIQNREFLAEIKKILPEESIILDETSLIFYSGDMWPRYQIKKMSSEIPETLPMAVLLPRSADDIKKILHLCGKHSVPVVPYGGGSGVCGAASAVHGCIVMDMKLMNRVLSIDEESRTVTVEPGILGSELEEIVNRKGYTTGHYPSSIMCSTVGGYIATRSAGQCSSAYGCIEDIVIEFEIISSDGSEITLKGGGNSYSAAWFEIFLGSEGTLGIITKAKLKLFALFDEIILHSFKFRSIENALEGMRQCMRRGLKPAVMRLYDPVDTLINEFSHEKSGSDTKKHMLKAAFQKITGISFNDLVRDMYGPAMKTLLSNPFLISRFLNIFHFPCLLIAGYTGDHEKIRLESAIGYEIMTDAGGEDIGEEPARQWYKKRYDISFKQSKVFREGAFVDTFEIASTWSRLPEIYHSVRKTVSRQAFVMAHFSHAYCEGCSIYFTVSGYQREKSALLSLYDWTVRTLLSTAISKGSCVSHHHGIGLMKRSFLDHEFQNGNRFYFMIKKNLDPRSIMNPDKLYPEVFSPVFEGNENVQFYQYAPLFKQADEKKEQDSNVVSPTFPEAISDLVKMANIHSRPIFAFTARKNIRKDAIFLDFSYLQEIIELDYISGTVTVQSGIKIRHLENFIMEKDFTLGNIPEDSYNLTMGEVLSRPAAISDSPLFRRIKDNCIGIHAILPDGSSFAAKPVPRRSAGPDIMKFILQSNGRYGIVTAACIRLFPHPSHRDTLAFECSDSVEALKRVRNVLWKGISPSRILMILRPNNLLQKEANRCKIIFSLAGTLDIVAQDSSLIRQEFEAGGCETENFRREERYADFFSESYELIRTFDWKDIFSFIKDMEKIPAENIPEMHFTGFTNHSVTVYLRRKKALVTEEAEKFFLKFKEGENEQLSGIEKTMKSAFDPNNILNPCDEASDV